MAKKPDKPDWAKESDFPPPLNSGEDMESLVIENTWVKSLNNSDPILGLLTITQPIGYCEFVIDEATANNLIQQLRQFIAGDSENASGEDDE
jgi:hypothetical protein